MLHLPMPREMHDGSVESSSDLIDEIVPSTQPN